MAQVSTDIATIYALSTAAGRAGVAVVRVSGPATKAVLRALGCDGLQPRVAALRKLVHPVSGGAIDRGLAIWFPGPASFTGEDLAEFHIHGGRAVVAALLEAVGTVAGCRLAEAGEFARRAFDNGKIDLAEAEGLADLIDAETEAQRAQALRQADGALSQLYEAWRGQVIQAQALVEAAIDFSDEGDVSSASFGQAIQLAGAMAGELAAHLDDGRRGEIVRDGFRVVLAGAPNVGKSSLLNALLQRDAAIVSPEAGTTRDVIEARLDLGGYPVVVLDTAGLHTSESAVEQEGMRRTLAQARIADLVIRMRDASQPDACTPGDSDLGDAPVLMVANKCDLVAESQVGADKDALSISVKTGTGLDALVEKLTVIVRNRAGLREDPALSQARHREQLTACLDHIQRFLSSAPDEQELRAEDLRLSATALGRITGRVDVEEILDQVFGRFCIGK